MPPIRDLNGNTHVVRNVECELKTLNDTYKDMQKYYLCARL